MAIITLTTDWTSKEHYAGMVKGRIFSMLPSVQLVDISHTIEPHNISQAAFVARNCIPYYPDHTVHIIDIASVSQHGHFVVIEKNKQFLVCTDNGLYSLIYNEPPDKVIQIEKFTEQHACFPTLDVFIPSAVHLANKQPIQLLGSMTELKNNNAHLRATIEENTLTGQVIYIDSYGNAITNVDENLFNRIGKGRPYSIFVQSNRNRIDSLSKYYDEVSSGELVAIFNTSGLLEIAINNGSVRDLLGLSSFESTIIIKFKESL